MNKRNGVIVGVLAIALVIVLVLWMRDRESQDLNIDLDIGAAARTTDGAMVAVPGNGRNPASESNGRIAPQSPVWG